MREVIINKIKRLESKPWIADSEKLEVINLYHRIHYCNDNCLIHRLSRDCCRDNFNGIEINQTLRDRIYRLIKEELIN